MSKIAQEATVFLPGNISMDSSAEFGISVLNSEFTPDLKQLFFTSNRSKTKNFHIYTSKYENGKWQNANLASFSGRYFDADAFVTLDGENVFFFSMRPLNNDSIPLKAPNIWYVEHDNKGWSQAKLIDSTINRVNSGEGYMSFTKNNTIYFSSVGREEGRKHDIYKSVFLNDSYSEPEFVNVDIETNFSNPYVSSDETFIIIDSKQAGGYGGNDLFISFREGNHWTHPRNLGPKVNTNMDEGTPSITPDGKLFFFSRDGDIYYISVQSLNLEH